ncbi:MAG: cobalamin B12-binding domain-containing protein [Bacteroidetes bacterium]|jgi:methylmalonyl-CoA mutase C-terminal domain/subunit|nr:cobalamin B12-binding domain-containing protein [Bacteroidota bacterium]
MIILLAKPGLDGHDVGVKVLAHALQEAGHQVHYTGLRKSVEFIVQRAMETTPDLICLSILSGSHLLICQRMGQLMAEKGISIPWLVGGNIPESDLVKLESYGATKAFATGTSIHQAVQYIESLAYA